MFQPSTAPATKGVAVVPHNTTEIEPTRALWVGVAGDIAVQFTDSAAAVTLKNVTVGLHAFSVKLVMAAGTTATDIVALR